MSTTQNMHAIIRAATRSTFKTRSNADCQFRANLHKTSAAYSELPSHSLPPTPFAKKLLVLDLNGTLLFRPSWSQPLHLKSGKAERPAFPRPFMRTFRKYLFHEETCSWLDTMVWSSAQPHNVATMVQSCFRNDQKKLVLVWGRDRMGLDRNSYNKKVPTMKNLETVWNYFKIKTEPSLPPYSAHNTILVDDSVEKAALQPYNHIYVRQYDFEQRRSDLSVTVFPAPSAPNVSHDATLLALIGMLEELKNEPNVPEWIQECPTAPRDLAADCNKPTASRKIPWFEDRTIEHHWAEKGKIIAAKLGIDVEAGVSRTYVPAQLSAPFGYCAGR